jgi:hypothetical protein
MFNVCIFPFTAIDAIRVGSMLPMCPSSDIEPPRLSIIDFTNSAYIPSSGTGKIILVFKLFFVKPDLSAIFTFSGVSLYFLLINVCFTFSTIYLVCIFFFLGGGEGVNKSRVQRSR